MIKFLTRHPEKIYIPLLEHIQLVFLTLVISVAIAAVLTLVCLRSDRLSMWLQQLLGVAKAQVDVKVRMLLEKLCQGGDNGVFSDGHCYTQGKGFNAGILGGKLL